LHFLFSLGFSLRERLDPVGLSRRGQPTRRSELGGAGSAACGAGRLRREPKGKETPSFLIGNESSAWERSHGTWRGAPEGRARRPLPPSAARRSPALPENSDFLHSRRPPSAGQEGWDIPGRWWDAVGQDAVGQDAGCRSLPLSSSSSPELGWHGSGSERKALGLAVTAVDPAWVFPPSEAADARWSDFWKSFFLALSPGGS